MPQVRRSVGRVMQRSSSLFFFEEAEDFVATVAGLDEVGIGLDVVDEPVLVRREFEVVVLFFELDDFAVEGIEGAVRQAVFLGEKGFLAWRIPAFVNLFVELAVVVKVLEDGLDDGLMAWLGGADEVVVGQAEFGGEGFPAFGEFIAVGLGGFAFFFGSLLDFLAVFVEAGEEIDFFAECSDGRGRSRRR